MTEGGLVLGFRHADLESEGVKAGPLDVVFTREELQRWERNLRALEERVGARRTFDAYDRSRPGRSSARRRRSSPELEREG